MSINASLPVTSVSPASIQSAQSSDGHVKGKAHPTLEKVVSAVLYLFEEYTESFAGGMAIVGALSLATAGMGIPLAIGLCPLLIAGSDSLNKAGTLFREAVQGKKSIAEGWKQLPRDDKITIIAILSFSALAITFAVGTGVLLFMTGPGVVALPFLYSAGGCVGAVLGPITHHYWARPSQQQHLPRS